MPYSVPTLLRRSPGLLLVGLLALLLWGQCGALLFPGTTRQAIAVKGWVASTDSLRTNPATLYLTLKLRNDLSRQVWVREARGKLQFNGRAHPFATPAALRDSMLYPWTDVTQAVAIPLRLPPDSVALLREALRIERQPTAEPRLLWKLQYSEKQQLNAHDQGQTRSYLPALK